MNLFSDDRQKIELFISCRSLVDMDVFSKSDPYVIMYLQSTQNGQQNGQFQEIGRTEMMKDNTNPTFIKTFVMDYIFEIQQNVKFVVMDYDTPQSSDFIGEISTTVSKIMGSKNQTIILDLKNKQQKCQGKIIIKGDKVNHCNDLLFIKIKLQKIPDTRWFSSTNAFLRFYRMANNFPLLVHETQFVNSTVNPSFPALQLSIQKLCNGVLDQPIKCEVWDHEENGAHVYLGEISFSIHELVDQEHKQFPIKNIKGNKGAGTFLVEQVSVIQKPSFVDFLRGGTQISMICAVDFTGSNGVPKAPTSLHAIHYDQLNQYQQAILSVGQILINYDYTKNVPMFGFGAKPRLPHFNVNQTLHCFPLNGYPQSPEVVGLSGMMDTYKDILNFVELSGPTLFNPLIQEAMKLANAMKGSPDDPYFVLLILTDGEIHDMEPTKTSIVQASHLPLSIIIIGVGNEQFENMQILDGDDGLVDCNGRKAQRDLVQFVPFNKYKNNPSLLAQHVLAELPDQLVEYNRLVGKAPRPPPQAVNISQMQVNLVPEVQLNAENNFANSPFMKNLVQGVQQPPQQAQQLPQQPLQQNYSQNSKNMGNHVLNIQLNQQGQQFNQPQQGMMYPNQGNQQFQQGMMYPNQANQFPPQQQYNQDQQNQQFPSQQGFNYQYPSN